MSRRKRTADTPFTQESTTIRQVRRKKPIGTEFLLDIEPITENQRKLFESYKEGKNLVAYGESGSGKTFICLYNALREVLNDVTPYETIYIVRSLVQTREIGFMPGPQPLDAKILTPSGWATMGEIKVGDYVIGRNGKPTKVLGVYPKGKKMVYKVTTTENTSTECCLDHLWLTKTFEDKKRQRPGSVKTTKEIIETLYNKKNKINHYIPRNEAVEFEKKELPIPPYTMGVILGDGSISNTITIYNKDVELIDKVNDELSNIGCKLTYPENSSSISYNISQKNIKSNKLARRIILNNSATNEIVVYETVGDAIKSLNVSQTTVYDRCKSNNTFNGFNYSFEHNPNKWTNPIKESCYRLGLEKTKSNTKFIPEVYKYSSIEDRIELLRGLMDTDGTVKSKAISKSCYCSFTTTSKKLADDVVELVQSLGGRSTYWIRDRRNYYKSSGNDVNVSNKMIHHRLISYDLSISLPKHINPFFISRKSSRFDPKYMSYIGIKSVEPVTEKEVQCILVEDPEHLYITDQYIVTHNTESQKQGYFEIPYKNMVKYMFKLPSEADFDMLYENLKTQKTIKFYNTSFIRGLTLDNCILIVDEMQNLSFHESDSIITRIGENSKIMFCGDASQSDLVKLSEKNGIYDFLKILRVMPSFDIIEFGIDDVCRSGIVKEYLIAKHELGL